MLRLIHLLEFLAFTNLKKEPAMIKCMCLSEAQLLYAIYSRIMFLILTNCFYALKTIKTLFNEIISIHIRNVVQLSTVDDTSFIVVGEPRGPTVHPPWPETGYHFSNTLRYILFKKGLSSILFSNGLSVSEVRTWVVPWCKNTDNYNQNFQ